MKRLRFRDNEDVPAAARYTSEVIARHGVVLLPTETFYGLAADPYDPSAVARIHEMKGRSAELGLPILCADWQQLESLVEVSEIHRVRLSRIWPRAVTAVMAARVEVAAARQGTLAVRIPAHGLLRALLYKLGPLTGTSANRHGDEACRTVDEALASLVEPPDLVLDGGASRGDGPSTVVDLIGDEARVLRTGVFEWHERHPIDGE